MQEKKQRCNLEIADDPWKSHQSKLIKKNNKVIIKKKLFSELMDFEFVSLKGLLCMKHMEN